MKVDKFGVELEKEKKSLNQTFLVFIENVKKIFAK